jgi:flagellar biosynthesis/type III secretory pathway M-ring protein FliF/YscJ
VREVKSPRGAVKKISAALLIDQDVEWQGKGAQRKRVFIPPTPEKLKAIHDVVAGVLGIASDRGDQLVVETLPFEQTRNAEDTAIEGAKPLAPGKLTLKDLMADKKILIGAGVGLLFILLLVGFLLRRPKSVPANAQLAEKPVILPGRADSSAALDKTEGGPEGNSRASGNAVKELEEILPVLQLPAMTSHTKLLLDHLRKTVTKDPDAAATVIRAWMEEA